MPPASRITLIGLACAVSFGIATPVVVAELPTPLSRFGNLPCLAPVIRAVDPDAPKHIGEALLLPPYRLLDSSPGLGTAHFPITAVDKATQEAFDQGVLHLHHLADRQAERCFRRAASLSPRHPMPYWGLAEACTRYPGRARVYAGYARMLAGDAAELSDRERQWVELACAYHEGAIQEGSPRGRRAERMRALEDLAYQFPEDFEVQAFLVRYLVLDQMRAGLPVQGRFAVDALLAKLSAEKPDHPVANYRPLLWLPARPVRAAAFANDAPNRAPMSATAWRVAAEAHVAVGDYRSALRCQEAAARIDFARLRSDFALVDEEPDTVASIAAHIETQIACGQTRAAVDLATHLIQIPRSVDPEGESAFVAGRRLLASALMRGARWRELHQACQPENGILHTGELSASHAHTLYWRAISEWHSGDKEAADATGEELESLFRQFLRAGSGGVEEKEIAHAVRSMRYLASLFEGGTEKMPDGGLLHIGELQLARLLADRGDHTAAIGILDRALSTGGNSPEAIATFCGVAPAVGRLDDAVVRFDTSFRRNASLADRDHPAFGADLQPVVEKLRLRGNWRLASQPGSNRALPSISDLGDPRWSPPAAAAFELRDPSGELRRLSDFRGKPVLLIFFVGVGCPYCVEQLKVFQPHEEAYSAAGIPIVTITTDSLQQLRETLEAADNAGVGSAAFPFPILADPSLETFRAYRCFDHFNNKALHGVYLLDPDGRILWDNISHQPFLQPEFLLSEGQRLLGIWSR